MQAKPQTSVAAPAQTVFPGGKWRIAAPESQGVDSENLEAAMEYLKSVCGEIGVSETVVVRNGVVIWKGDNVDNRHTVWSCTKSFLSTCLGLLWDDGKCSPAMLASKFFPKLEKDYRSVTLGHLATFTSGYGGAESDPLNPQLPRYKPGAAFHYADEQSDLLAAILTRVAGEPLQDLFARRIGNEIGLTDVNFRWGSFGTIDEMTLNGGSGMPGRAIECTALAMARFGWFYCNGGNWNGQQLISRRYIDYATVPRVASNVPPHDSEGWYTILPGSYGLNWWVNGITPKGRRMWPGAPVNTFAAQGNNNNICFLIPDWKMVIVRLGGDCIIDTDLYDRMFALIKNAGAAESKLEVQQFQTL